MSPRRKKNVVAEMKEVGAIRSAAVEAERSSRSIAVPESDRLPGTRDESR